MAHADAMAERLPLLYAQGETVRGLLALVGVQLEILDQDMAEVQRAHWFDSCLEREEAERLAAVLGIDAEPWQELPELRAWVHALRTAMLDHGSVTPRALQAFVERYVALLQEAVGVPHLLLRQDLEAGDWSADPGAARRDAAVPLFLEHPVRRRVQTAPPTGTPPLTRFTVTNRGLDPAPAGFLLSGRPGGPEHVPVIVNTTNGEALVHLGPVPQGQRLWIDHDAESGLATARLESVDVSDRLRLVTGVRAGQAWSRGDVRDPPRGLTLEPGDNELWFLPVAHFDAGGLDRFLLALADEDLAQGRFDQTRYDSSLFALQAAVAVHVTWQEVQPATVDIRLPGGALMAGHDDTDAALAHRDRLGAALDGGVDRLAAAGVATRVVVDAFRETQPQVDHLVRRLPLTEREVGPTGADNIQGFGARFDVTGFEESTWR